MMIELFKQIVCLEDRELHRILIEVEGGFSQ